jgi:ubiquinone/menaquinone biosynthesis C-methylase UbiE
MKKIKIAFVNPPSVDTELFSPMTWIWMKSYYDNFVYSGSVGIFKRLIHKFFENSSNLKRFETILEVGAGSGEHKPFVKNNYDRYIEVDLRKTNHIKDFNSISEGSYYEDAITLSSIPDASIDRLIATCLIVHLKDPESALINWKRVVREGGVINIYVPCEPRILLRALQNATTKRKAAKLGFSFNSVHWRDHINNWIYIDTLINEVFENSKITRRRFPFRWLPWDLAIFDVYDISVS